MGKSKKVKRGLFQRDFYQTGLTLLPSLELLSADSLCFWTKIIPDQVVAEFSMFDGDETGWADVLWYHWDEGNPNKFMQSKQWTWDMRLATVAILEYECGSVVGRNFSHFVFDCFSQSLAWESRLHLLFNLCKILSASTLLRNPLNSPDWIGYYRDDDFWGDVINQRLSEILISQPILSCELSAILSCPIFFKTLKENEKTENTN